MQLLPKPPASTERATSFGTTLQMYDNDQLGDCTCAGIGNLTQFWRSLTSLREPLTTGQVVATYEKICGYVPGDPTTDRGGVELEVLKAWQRDGIYGHQLGAFAAVNLRNEALIRLASWMFDGLYLGVALPVTAQDQDVWDVDLAAGSAAYPGSWGGHAIVLLDYNEQGPVYGTWGAQKQATWAWHEAYCDEQWALISPDQLTADGDTAEGFDSAALTRDLQIVTAA
jgi:hypothetical protein